MPLFITKISTLFSIYWPYLIIVELYASSSNKDLLLKGVVSNTTYSTVAFKSNISKPKHILSNVLNKLRWFYVKKIDFYKFCNRKESNPSDYL